MANIVKADDDAVVFNCVYNRVQKLVGRFWLALAISAIAESESGRLIQEMVIPVARIRRDYILVSGL